MRRLRPRLLLPPRVVLLPVALRRPPSTRLRPTRWLVQLLHRQRVHPQQLHPTLLLLLLRRAHPRAFKPLPQRLLQARLYCTRRLLHLPLLRRMLLSLVEPLLVARRP